MVTRTFRYRLYPTASQEARLRVRHRVKGWEIQHDATARYGRLVLSEAGPVRARLHRPVPPGVRSLGISCECGEWWASFVCHVQPEQSPAPEEAVGVDVGEWVIAVDSEGGNHYHASAFKSGQRAFTRARGVARKRQEGSRRCRQAKEAQERAARRVLRCRRDAAHKIARHLVNRFDLIAVERIGSLPDLAAALDKKSAAKATWEQLFRLLKEKAKAEGRRLVGVQAHQSSQECSDCGVVTKKALSERQHTCPECGLTLSRDHNAAINIRDRGLALEIATMAEKGWLQAGELARRLMA